MAAIDAVTENLLNVAAQFLPQDGEGTRPCLVVGGVQVYAYFHGGQLHVSIDYDTAIPAVVVDGAVPTRVTVGVTDVWHSNTEDKR